MGQLVDGQWTDDAINTKTQKGKFVRQNAAFRSWITPDGAAGPSGDAGFKAEPDRYHLYVSLACPWAHRALIFRKLKGLEDAISLSVVNAYMGDQGWSFEAGDDVIADPVNDASHMHQVYTAADPGFTGRVTVPVLWDKQQKTIVSNESSEIIRMFNSAFDAVGANAGDYYPEQQRNEIDAINDTIYSNVNNGVYKSGFATSQQAYDESVTALFETLDTLENRLGQQRYLVGKSVTEADWRLFTTLIRFDPVYVGHFKCNRRRIADYPNLSGYLRDLYQMPGIADTVNIKHTKRHYYESHKSVNPTGIVPQGPDMDLMAPHGRESLG